MHILLIQHIQQEFINQNQLNTEAYHGNKSQHTIKQYKDYFLTIMQSRLRQEKPDSHCDTDSLYQRTSGKSP